VLSWCFVEEMFICQMKGTIRVRKSEERKIIDRARVG
jgi:hypothetical protein